MYQEVEVLQEMVEGPDGKKRLQYDVNYGALMSSGRCFFVHMCVSHIVSYLA